MGSGAAYDLANSPGIDKVIVADRDADRAKFVRTETVRLARIAGAGHYSSTFSAAELFAALYYAHLRINPAEPKWLLTVWGVGYRFEP